MTHNSENTLGKQTSRDDSERFWVILGDICSLVLLLEIKAEFKA